MVLKFPSSSLILLLSCHWCHIKYSCMTTVFLGLAINRWVDFELQIFEHLYAKFGTVWVGNNYKMYISIIPTTQYNSHSDNLEIALMLLFLPQIFSCGDHSWFSSSSYDLVCQLHYHHLGYLFWIYYMWSVSLVRGHILYCNSWEVAWPIVIFFFVQVIVL